MCVWGGLGVSSEGEPLNLLSRLLSRERALGFLVVNSDLAPELEGGAEKQKEPLAWIQNRSFLNFSAFKSLGIPIHWELLGI